MADSQASSSANPTSARPRWKRVLRCVGWMIVVLYFVFGSLVIAGRWFFTTQIDRYRDDVSQWVSQAMGIDVHIDNLHGGFDRFWPTLTLDNVTLSQPNHPVSLTLPNVYARFSWASLWSGAPQFELLQINQPSLTIRRLDKNHFEIAGFTFEFDPLLQSKSSSTQQPLLEWVLSQKRIQLRDGSVHYHDETASTQETIDLNAIQMVFEKRLLAWRFGLAGTRLGREQPEHFQLALHSKPPLLPTRDPFKWETEVYLKNTQTDVAELLQKLPLPHIPVQLSSGMGATEMWMNFTKGKLNRWVADVDLRNVQLQWGNNRPPLSLPRAYSRIHYDQSIDKSATSQPSSERLSLQNLVLQEPQHLHRARLISVLAEHTQEGTRYQIEADQTDLNLLENVIPSLPLEPELISTLSALQMTGDVRHLMLKIPAQATNWHQYTLEGIVTDLAFRNTKAPWPSFQGLSLELKTSTPGTFTGNVSVSKEGTLRFPGVFERDDIALTGLTATFQLALKPEVSLDVPQFMVENNEVALRGKAHWVANTEHPAGTLQLTGQILRAQATQVPYYLPLSLGEDLLKYLHAAIQAGELSTGRFDVRGPLHRFPWHRSNNPDEHFLIEATLEKGQYDFLPVAKNTKERHRYGAWPLLSNIDATLSFEGNGMTIKARNVLSHGLTSKNAVVAIDNFSTPILTVDADITGDLKQGLGYIKDTPFLNGLVNGAFDDSTGSGPIKTQLSLSIPLDKGDSKVDVRSQVSNATFSYGRRYPNIKDVKGELRVTDTEVTSPVPFTGQTDAGPISVQVSTDKATTQIKVNALATLHDTLRLIDQESLLTPLTPGIQGKTPIEVIATIERGTAPLVIRGTSELKGVTLALPSPLVKSSETAWPFTFTYRQQGVNQSLTLNVDKQLFTQLDFTTLKENPSLRGVISLGSSSHELPSRGLGLRIQSDEFNVDAWKALIGNDNTVSSNLPLSEIELSTGLLTIDSKMLHRLDLHAQHHIDKGWEVALRSNEAFGTFTYRPKTEQMASVLTGRFTRLYLTKQESDDLDTLLKPEEKPTDLPDLLVRVDDFRINDRQIGSLSIDAHNEGKPSSLWILRQLKILNPGATIDITGSWKNGITQLNAKANITDTGKVLSSLQYPDAMRGAPGAISADFRWVGVPTSPDYPSLSGHIQGELGSGQFLQVEPGAGRLLSLLSIQHLLRRLTFDFRDVFGKGFTFDTLHLEGSIDQGIFSTPKLTLLGSSASVVTEGSINLVNDTLSLHSVVLPSINVAGPSLALALINPAIGLGTFVSQFVFQDQLSELFKSEYRISGSLDNPTVTKIESSHPASSENLGQ
ncbi:MAG: YhdP family protein [Sutterella sp.]|nr:YhdP family protein [Sutterella sp.]